ncbi:MAG: hypothetical protein ACRDYU_09955 [Actinomycetes bacterium]
MTMQDSPEVTDDLRAAARERPGGWVYAIDALVDPDARVPGHSIRGGWPVDANGEVNDAGFTPNPHYRPHQPDVGEVVSAVEALLSGRPTERALVAIGRAAVTIAVTDSGPPVVERAEPAIEAFVTENDARGAYPDARGWTRTTVRDLASHLTDGVGLEVVLPDGRRAGIRATGIAGLLGNMR